MKKYNLTNTGGFPFDQSVLSDFQDNISDAQNVATALAALFILSGCVVTDDIATSGVVSINGEILAFAGGTIASTVYIENVEVAGIYEDGSSKPIKNTRAVKFGTGDNQYNWADFKQNSIGILARLEKLEKMCAPIATGGAPVLWNRPYLDIPPGWQECVDFRGRMAQGFDPDDADFNIMGNSGGEKKHSLTIAEMPAHKFNNGVVDDKETGDSGNVFPYGQTSQDLSGWSKGNVTNTGGGGAAYQGYTNTLGNNQAHNIMSPYRIVMYIVFIG